jgi:hypothetical protein
MSRYNVSPIAMGWTPPEGLIMVKKWVLPTTCVIQSGMWPYAMWKQSWNN